MPQRAGERVAQKRGVGEVRDRRLFHHSAILEHGNAIGNAQRELDIVRDQQHAVALVGEGAEVVQRSDRKVEVELDGGKLTVEWDEATNHVFMTGPAELVFTGEIDG